MCLLLVSCSSAFANSNFWQDATLAARSLNTEISSIRYFNSDQQALRDFLHRVPSEASGITGPVISLPMPDGSLASYHIVESPIMEDALAAKYPEIKTFKVYGIDDPVASGRIDISPHGFSAMLHTSQGRVFVDPDPTLAMSSRYSVRMRIGGSETNFKCSAGKMISSRSRMPMSMSMPGNRLGNRVAGALMTYRLAISTTPDYVAFAGGTDSLVAAEITRAINRVNQIYERDLGIRLLLVANNDWLNGLVPNGEISTLMEVNQILVDNKIGSGSYDIGHVFSAPVDFNNSGGIANIASVCNNGNKAKAATGLVNPVGEAFYIDFIAHEIGHQFGAEHSFNGTTRACSGVNRVASSAFEPGSGSTIMSYAGICGVENLQTNSDATFHAGSIAQIHAFAASAGRCNALVSASNPNDPVADAGINRFVPIVTAFQLEGSGNDADGDTLSYQWDQMDAGAATTADTLGDDLGTNALFRSYLPQSSGSRDFPALGTQVVDGPYDQSETLPCTSRNLNFRLTVRDGKSGQAIDDVQITVDSGTGPFRITSHNVPGTVIVEGSPTQIVTWDVANTDRPPVSCPSVDIDLLTFSVAHNSYSETRLQAPTPNDGAEAVTLPLPLQSNSRARFRVKCSNNIFYDISDTDIDIQADPANGDFPVSGNTTFSNPNGLFATSSSCVVAPVSTGGGGGGVFDELWMLLLAALITSLKLFGRHQLGAPFSLNPSG